jgi:DNA (cytosine-5)-methyltransferase 1
MQIQVGDVAIVPIGEEPNKKAPRFPEPHEINITDTIPKYFWFARIIYIDGAEEIAHVQWFQHSSLTGNLGEIHDPQELFLVDQCDTIALSSFAGKVVVHHVTPITPKNKPTYPPSEYYYKCYFSALFSTNES